MISSTNISPAYPTSQTKPQSSCALLATQPGARGLHQASAVVQPPWVNLYITALSRVEGVLPEEAVRWVRHLGLCTTRIWRILTEIEGWVGAGWILLPLLRKQRIILSGNGLRMLSVKVVEVTSTTRGHNPPAGMLQGLPRPHLGLLGTRLE